MLTSDGRPNEGLPLRVAPRQRHTVFICDKREQSLTHRWRFNSHLLPMDQCDFCHCTAVMLCCAAGFSSPYAANDTFFLWYFTCDNFLWHFDSVLEYIYIYILYIYIYFIYTYIYFIYVYIHLSIIQNERFSVSLQVWSVIFTKHTIVESFSATSLLLIVCVCVRMCV